MGMIDFSEIGLFKTKDGRHVSYENLLADIYDNSTETKETLKVLVNQMTGLIKKPADAMMLMEHITALIDTRVKNDDLLVKVASIVSRIIQRGMTSVESGSDWEISPEEKQQLLSVVKAEDILDINESDVDIKKTDSNIGDNL